MHRCGTIRPRRKKESEESSSLAFIPEQDIPEEAIGKKQQQQPQGSSAADGYMDSFPFKVYRLLAYVEMAKKTHTVSFCPGDMNKPIEFENEIMPLFFNTNRVASFQRQLNQYHFKRVTEGPYRGGFLHKEFLKGIPLSCKNIKRKRMDLSSNMMKVN